MMLRNISVWFHSKLMDFMEDWKNCFELINLHPVATYYNI